MKKLDNLEFTVNRVYDISDKLNILIPDRNISLNITDKYIKNAFIELYDSIPKKQLNLLKTYENALKNPEKLKKFLQRKDVRQYIIWNKKKLCYEFDLKVKLNITDEHIQNAFNALYPAIEEFKIEEFEKKKVDLKKYNKEGQCIMNPKNKKINDLFRQAVGINTNEENINDNNKDNNIENQTNNVKNKNKNTRNSNKFIKENTKNTKNSNKFTKTSNKFMNEQIRGAAKKNDGLLEHLKRNKDIENAFKGGGNND